MAAGISSILFYPLELRRIKASAKNVVTEESINDFSNEINDKYTNEAIFNNLCSIVKDALDLYNYSITYYSVGNTMFASFMYYALYGSLKLKLRNKETLTLSWSSNFLAANIAAILSVLISFPLEGIICRVQLNESVAKSNEIKVRNNTSILSDTITNLFQITRFWRGVTPALFLCLNPTIHYTVYENLQVFLIRMKSSMSLNNEKQIISAKEAFVIGFISKLIATLISYPLVRTKLLLISDQNSCNKNVCSTCSFNQGSSSSLKLQTTFCNCIAKEEEEDNAKTNDFVRMLQVFYMLVVFEGFKGMYKGISTHILHSSLRGALSMVFFNSYILF